MPFCMCNLSLLILLCPTSHLSRNPISYTSKEIQNPATHHLHCCPPGLSRRNLASLLSLLQSILIPTSWVIPLKHKTVQWIPIFLIVKTKILFCAQLWMPVTPYITVLTTPKSLNASWFKPLVTCHALNSPGLLMPHASGRLHWLLST